MTLTTLEKLRAYCPNIYTVSLAPLSIDGGKWPIGIHGKFNHQSLIEFSSFPKFPSDTL